MRTAIDSGIAKLRSDSGCLDFTGFIVNAHICDTPTVKGEIWGHAGAGSSDQFTDGCLIMTSALIEINSCDSSVWVVTKDGSRYGILSFTALGWVYFINLYRAYDRLDQTPANTPRLFMPAFPGRHSGDEITPSKLHVLKVKAELRKSEGRLKRTKPLRPEKDPNELKRLMEHVEATIDTLKRNGVTMNGHEL
ncbi:hypothetical protein HU723_11595 [Pseudomonas lurida]|uniref:hypothetical protein n=1 Tax=Pseudomonas lurida TaxID=244566 RepID=UPI00164750A6|nr:hypothetical protein [Pseudomonas lurida]MBC3239821.1 hypothetical protein [Pseudomonas lurida]